MDMGDMAIIIQHVQHVPTVLIIYESYNQDKNTVEPLFHHF